MCDCVGTGVITGGTGNPRPYGRAGGGVYVDGTFIMTGGTISGNEVNDKFEDGGGGVYVSENGAFKMSGGTISGNSADVGGGVSFYDGCQDVQVNETGTFEMTGGTISGNTARRGQGGGVYVTATFEMSGGTISENTGGGVYVDYGKFIMSDGTISGNTAENGGGVCVEEPYFVGGESLSLTASSYAAGDNDATFTMTGGTISENTATQDGGGVFVSGGNEGGFEMTGGTISGNTAQGYGGGVCVGGAFKVSGAPDITGNKVNGVNDNVSMDLYTTITVTGELTEGAKMGVTLADGFSGAFTDGYGENNKDGNNIIAPDEYFVSDADGYFPALDGGEVILVTGKATVTTGGTTTEYATLQAAWAAANDATAAAIVRMYADAEITSMLIVESGKYITLDLNGHILKWLYETYGSAIQVNGTFTLADSNTQSEHDYYIDEESGLWVFGDDGEHTLHTLKGGVITGGKASSTGGGVKIEGGTFILAGGTICGNKAVWGGGVHVKCTYDVTGLTVVKYARFEMTGGVICGNEATNGSGVYLDKHCTFEMTGGKIIDNTAKINGGGVNVGSMSEFIMTAGTISGNTAAFGGGVRCDGTFKVSGTPKITDNKAAENSYNNVFGNITVTGALTEGAKIGVNDTGEVATGFKQADKPSKYFIPDDPANNCIYVSDETSGTVIIGVHVWNDGAVTTQPTCTDEGEKTFTCTGCGATKTQTVDALGHDYSDEFTVDTPATCTTAGSKSKHCSRCDSVTDVTEIPALLSVGALVGIVIGGFILLLLIAYVVCYFALYRRGILLKGKFFDAIYVPMNAIFGKNERDSETENS